VQKSLTGNFFKPQYLLEPGQTAQREKIAVVNVFSIRL
jgi:hypothetical protein